MHYKTVKTLVHPLSRTNIDDVGEYCSVVSTPDDMRAYQAVAMNPQTLRLLGRKGAAEFARGGRFSYRAYRVLKTPSFDFDFYHLLKNNPRYTLPAAELGAMVSTTLRSGFSVRGTDGRPFFDIRHPTPSGVRANVLGEIPANPSPTWYLLDVSKAARGLVVYDEKKLNVKIGLGLWQTIVASLLPLTSDHLHQAAALMNFPDALCLLTDDDIRDIKQRIPTPTHTISRPELQLGEIYPIRHP